MSANTFRALIVCWIAIGIVLCGAGMAFYVKSCPYDTIDDIGPEWELGLFVLMWPSVLIGGMLATYRPERELCKHDGPMEIRP